MTVLNNPISERIPPKSECSEYVQIGQFRVKDLQKISDVCLFVFQMRNIVLNDRLNNTVSIEVKVNMGFPLISGSLKDFREWITKDTLKKPVKNTWV